MRDLDVMKNVEHLGLVQVYAYHCERCNYTWLPKDFDMLWCIGEELGHPEQRFYGEDLLYREPPKSCARCKSKSWKKLPPSQRKLKRKHILENKIDNEYRNSNPWITNMARLRSLGRQNKLTVGDITQINSNLAYQALKKKVSD